MTDDRDDLDGVRRALIAGAPRRVRLRLLRIFDALDAARAAGHLDYADEWDLWLALTDDLVHGTDRVATNLRWLEDPCLAPDLEHNCTARPTGHGEAMRRAWLALLPVLEAFVATGDPDDLVADLLTVLFVTIAGPVRPEPARRPLRDTTPPRTRALVSSILTNAPPAPAPRGAVAGTIGRFMAAA